MVASRGIHPLFDVVLHRFHHDDGVIDHQADGQHQAEERERVDGEAERRKDNEGADERDRHGQQRNEGGAPALEEDEDDNDDQAERFEQREHDLVDAGGDRLGRVQRDIVGDAGGKGRRELLHTGIDGGGGLRPRWTRVADRWPCTPEGAWL